MTITTTAPLDTREHGYRLDTSSHLNSAVSWGAIVAGAAAAASFSLILLILGVGLGLSSVSPWTNEGISAASFGISTIVWLTVTQLLSSGMGGYLAGRLRTKWMDAPTDEIFFRDTAHGFLSWAIASLATATLLTSVVGSIVNGGIQAGASVAGGAATSATLAAGGAAAAAGKMASEENGPMAYFVDSLFRKEGSVAATPASDSTDEQLLAPSQKPASERPLNLDATEVSRIFSNLSLSEPLPPEDVRYVGQLVAQRTGLSQQDAEKRVTDTYARAQAKLQETEAAAKDAADKARKASAYAALWIFVSMLVGAFVASFAATFGGRQRDA